MSFDEMGQKIANELKSEFGKAVDLCTETAIRVNKEGRSKEVLLQFLFAISKIEMLVNTTTTLTDVKYQIVDEINQIEEGVN